MFDGLRFQHWQPELRADGLVVLRLDRADRDVNALSQDVLEELEQIVERLAIGKPAGVVIASGKAAGFAPGADISEFREFDRRGVVDERIRAGQRILDALATLPVPTVAAIHGHCMGGGTELALACDYRVAATEPATRIGLPEVRLGIYPGWGGSVRLPRLVGAPAAMDLMLSGRTLSATAARRIGLLDALADPAMLVDAALELARRGHRRPWQQRLLAWTSNLWPVRQVLAPLLARRVARKARRDHYPAPYALIDTWRRSGGTMRSRLAAEARSVSRLAQTPTARNLLRVYFLQERLKGLGDGEHGVGHVHVVGAGVMGGDIAAWNALKGFEVSLQDRDEKAVSAAIERAHALFERRAAETSDGAEARNRLVADIDGTAAARADLVIEAIYEDPDAKKAVYAALEPGLADGAILATNTSSIALDGLADSVQRPERFAGLHFFNPVARMPLVEIVRHARLEADVQQRLAAYCRALGKLPVVVAGSPGFLVNRILMPYLLEAMHCHAEGVPAPVIDRAAVRFGMPMGPIELADTIGLDVAASVGGILAEHLGLPVPEGLEAGLQAGRRGRKDGEGFYVWEQGRPKKPPVPRQYRAPEDLEDRLILPLVNEAVACLHDGVVADADLLDAGVVFGTGFAPFRGGPLHHARSVGPATLRARLEELAQRHGPRFDPRPGWDALQEEPADTAAGTPG